MEITIKIGTLQQIISTTSEKYKVLKNHYIKYTLVLHQLVRNLEDKLEGTLKSLSKYEKVDSMFKTSFENMKEIEAALNGYTRLQTIMASCPSSFMRLILGSNYKGN